MAKNNFDNYGVIGAGTFGIAVACKLAENGKSVIVIDRSEEKLKALSGIVDSVYQVNTLNRESLEEAGIGNCGTVVIAIGENLQASILATLECIELGVPNVISKAGSQEHGKILSKIGARVVFPEMEGGERLAYSLSSHANMEMLPLSEDFSIISLDLNPVFTGKTLVELDWRRRYDINVIALITDGKAHAAIRPDSVIPAGTRAVLAGSNQALERFRKINAKRMD